jgi:hypothetical protein
MGHDRGEFIVGFSLSGHVLWLGVAGVRDLGGGAGILRAIGAMSSEVNNDAVLHVGRRRVKKRKKKYDAYL